MDGDALDRADAAGTAAFSSERPTGRAADVAGTTSHGHPGPTPHPSDPSAHGVPDPARTSPATATFPWPPPHLEPLLGAGWRVGGAAVAGSVLLYAPLLYLLTVGRAALPSPGGPPAWLAEAIALLGLFALGATASHARRLVTAVRVGLDAGHGRWTALEVAADHRGDAALVACGAREYAALPPEARMLLRANRVAAGTLALLAGATPTFGFLMTMVLAYAGAASPATAWILTLGPIALLGGLALAARAAEHMLLAVPRRTWAREAKDDVERDVAAWAERFETTRTAEPGRGATGAPASLWILGSLTTVATLAVVVFAVLVGATAFRARIVADVVPRTSVISSRIAALEAARPYRLPPDSAITAEAAGQALHALLLAGRHADADARLLLPERLYDAPLARPSEAPPFRSRMPTAEWVQAAAAGLSAEQQAHLRARAEHPALAEFAMLARAGELDVVGTRYVLPFPDDAAEWDLPVPSTTPFQVAAEAMVARALLALDAGRVAEAETTLREVLSAGLLLADEATFYTDAMAGVAVASTGLTLLEALYDATGRATQAAEIARLAETARRAAAVAGGHTRASATGIGARAGVPPADVALDPDAPRAVRWERALAHVMLTECGSLRRRIFGESDEYRAWKDDVRAALVRTPGEEALFEVIVESPARARAPRERNRWNPFGLAARLLPGGPRCSVVWSAL